MEQVYPGVALRPDASILSDQPLDDPAIAHLAKPRRTPEAQADIAAARAAPTAMEQVDDEHDEHDAVSKDWKQTRADLAAALSNAAIADTPAVREMGGPQRSEVDDVIAERANDPRRPTDALLDGPDCVRCGKPTSRGLEAWAAIHAACTPQTMPPPGAIVLTGDEAARYRALQDAARHAHETARAAQAAGADMRDKFQAMIAGFAPGKGP